jgi:regulator of protease activity HflC (stomatin/prohibitin superfamily)
MNFFTDLGRFILEIIGYLWPLSKVHPWEKGAYYFCGWYLGDVGTGLYPVIPWFLDLRVEGTISMTFVTPLQTITTQDGGTLTYSASVKLRVVNLGQAYNSVLEWHETALEDITAALSEKLAEVDVQRLEPASRGRLIGACKRTLDTELDSYGVGVDRLRFNNFVRNMRVYRLFNDQVVSNH